MRCVRSPAHLRPRTRAHKLAFTPRIVIETNSPAHAESSPHVRRTLDINRESDIHAVAGTPQTPISIHALRKESDPGTLRLTKRSKNFNPHSPCGERLSIDDLLDDKYLLHQFPTAPNTSKCKDQTLSDYTFRLSNNNPKLHQGSSFNFLRTKKVRTYL